MVPTSSPRSRPAAAGLLAVVLAASLGGCGDPAEPAPMGDGDATSQTSEDSTGGPRPGPVDHDLLTVVSTTLGGGRVDGQAVDLTGPGGVDQLVAGLESGMPAQVARAVRRAQRRAAVREALDGGAGLYGAVVWVGCETPEEIRVVQEDGGLVARALVPDKGSVQCLAPVTSVAVFTA